MPIITEPSKTIDLNNKRVERQNFDKLRLPTFLFLSSGTFYESKIVSTECIQKLIGEIVEEGKTWQATGLKIVPLIESNGEINIYLEPVFENLSTVGPVNGPGVGPVNGPGVGPVNGPGVG